MTIYTVYFTPSSSITTTMKFYIKNTDENKKKAVRGLEELV
jgi:hypothetical protein